jgi:CubicO group peptidase (beta-lactamase class C family)
MNKKAVFVAACCFATACTSGSAPEEVARKAEQYLQALTDSGRFSGTVLLARQGKTLFVKGYGFANEESQVPNAAATRFPIASITKTFTATLVLQQQELDRLSIADPVCKHFEPCPPAWRDITIRHLLMHTSGIPNFTVAPDFMTQAAKRRTPEEVIATFRDLPLQFAPGAKYHYSNSGYFVLGAILEKVSGKSFPALLEESIFKPLGMNDSGHDNQAPVQPPLAIGYRPHGALNATADFVDSSWLYAMGGGFSTVEDLHKFVLALSTDALLPPRELAGMWSPELGQYGYGWQMLPPSAQTLNRQLVFHAGGIPGYSTDLLRYPDDDVTVIILANLHPVALAEVSRDLSAIVLGESYSVPPVRRAAKIDPAVYNDYAGLYEINPNVSITVAREGDQLAVQATGQPKDFAVPESETTFFSRISPARLSFAKDATGKVDRLIIHDADRDIPAIRKMPGGKSGT